MSTPVPAWEDGPPESVFIKYALEPVGGSDKYKTWRLRAKLKRAFGYVEYVPLTPKVASSSEMLRELKDVQKLMRSILRGDMMAAITHADLGAIDDVIAKAEGRQ
jgi:hypothetical protein